MQGHACARWCAIVPSAPARAIARAGFRFNSGRQSRFALVISRATNIPAEPVRDVRRSTSKRGTWKPATSSRKHLVCTTRPRHSDSGAMRLVLAAALVAAVSASQVRRSELVPACRWGSTGLATEEKRCPLPQLCACARSSLLLRSAWCDSSPTVQACLAGRSGLAAVQQAGALGDSWWFAPSSIGFAAAHPTCQSAPSQGPHALAWNDA